MYGDCVSVADLPSLPHTVFQKYTDFKKEFDDVSVLDTRTFLEGLKIGKLTIKIDRRGPGCVTMTGRKSDDGTIFVCTGQETSIELEHGKTLFIKLNAVGEVDSTGHRAVIFEVRILKPVSI